MSSDTHSTDSSKCTMCPSEGSVWTGSKLKKHGALDVSHSDKFDYIGPMSKRDDHAVKNAMHEEEGSEDLEAGSVSCGPFKVSAGTLEHIVMALTVVQGILHFTCFVTVLALTEYYSDFRSEEPIVSIDPLMEALALVGLVPVFLGVFLKKPTMLLVSTCIMVLLSLCLVASHSLFLTFVMNAFYYPQAVLLHLYNQAFMTLCICMLVLQNVVCFFTALSAILLWLIV